MADKKATIPAPKYAIESEDKPAELSAEAETLAAQISMGIEYRETFTLADALRSYNQTRADIPTDGRTITAAEQRLSLDPAWMARHAGSFTFRRPAFYDNLKIRVRTEELTRGGTVKLATLWLAEAAALCETILTDKPDWFDLDQDIDLNAMWLIHHWYLEWSFRFRKAS